MKYTGILAALLLTSTASAEDRYISAAVQINFIGRDKAHTTKVEKEYTSTITSETSVLLPEQVIRRGWRCFRSALKENEIRFDCSNGRNAFILADSAIAKKFPSVYTQAAITEVYHDGVAVILFSTSMSVHPTGIKNEIRVVIPGKQTQ